MDTKSKQQSWISVTCESCGKTSGKKQTGTHWICEDCKVNEFEDRTSNPNQEQ